MGRVEISKGRRGLAEFTLMRTKALTIFFGVEKWQLP